LNFGPSIDLDQSFKPKRLEMGGKLGLTGNKSTSNAWTCLFNCKVHANDVFT